MRDKLVQGIPDFLGVGCREAFLTLGSRQFETVVQFYEGLLSQKSHPYWPNRYAELQLPGLRLSIFQPATEHKSEFSQSANSGMSLCLEVADLERAIAHLTALGYPPPGSIITASHGREIYAYDPDGNRLILHQTHANRSGGSSSLDDSLAEP